MATNNSQSSSVKKVDNSDITKTIDEGTELLNLIKKITDIYNREIGLEGTNLGVYDKSNPKGLQQFNKSNGVIEKNKNRIAELETYVSSVKKNIQAIKDSTGEIKKVHDQLDNDNSSGSDPTQQQAKLTKEKRQLLEFQLAEFEYAIMKEMEKILSVAITLSKDDQATKTKDILDGLISIIVRIRRSMLTTVDGALSNLQLLWKYGDKIDATNQETLEEITEWVKKTTKSEGDTMIARYTEQKKNAKDDAKKKSHDEQIERIKEIQQKAEGLGEQKSEKSEENTTVPNTGNIGTVGSGGQTTEATANAGGSGGQSSGATDADNVQITKWIEIIKGVLKLKLTSEQTTGLESILKGLEDINTENLVSSVNNASSTSDMFKSIANRKSALLSVDELLKNSPGSLTSIKNDDISEIGMIIENRTIDMIDLAVVKLDKEKDESIGKLPDITEKTTDDVKKMQTIKNDYDAMRNLLDQLPSKIKRTKLHSRLIEDIAKLDDGLNELTKELKRHDPQPTSRPNKREEKGQLSGKPTVITTDKEKQTTEATNENLTSGGSGGQTKGATTGQINKWIETIESVIKGQKETNVLYKHLTRVLSALKDINNNASTGKGKTSESSSSSSFSNSNAKDTRSIDDMIKSIEIQQGALLPIHDINTTGEEYLIRMKELLGKIETAITNASTSLVIKAATEMLSDTESDKSNSTERTKLANSTKKDKDLYIRMSRALLSQLQYEHDTDKRKEINDFALKLSAIIGQLPSQSSQFSTTNIAAKKGSTLNFTPNGKDKPSTPVIGVTEVTQVNLPLDEDAPDDSKYSEEEAVEPSPPNEKGIENPANAAYITVRYFNSPWDCKDPGHRQEIMRYFVNNGKKYNGKVAHDLGDKELGKSWPKDEHKTPLDATFSYAKSLDDINQKIKESLDGDDINKNTNPEAYWKYVNEKIKCSEKLKAVRRRLEDEYQLEIAADDDRLRWTFEFWEFREGDNMTGDVWEVIEEQYKKDNIIILFEFSLPGKQERWFYLFKETDLLVECRRGTGFSMQINTHGKEKFKILLWSDPDMMIVLKSRQVSYISIKVYEVVKLNVEGGKSDGNLAAASKNDHDVVNKDIIPVEEISNPPVIPNNGAKLVENLEKNDSEGQKMTGLNDKEQGSSSSATGNGDLINQPTTKADISISSNINDLPSKGNGSINRSTVRPQKKRRINVKEIGINIDEFMSK